MSISITHISWIQVEKEAETIANHINMVYPDQDLLLYGIPRGGIIPAILVMKYLQQTRHSINMTNEPSEANIFIDDIIDSGNTKRRYQFRYPCTPFYALIEKGGKPMWFEFPWEKLGEELGAEENIVRILEYIGEDIEREGLTGTPKRVIKSYEKLFEGYKWEGDEQYIKEMLKIFHDAYDQIVVLKDIEFYSTCEHHMLPFFGKAHIGYLPNGKILGISKLARLLEIYVRRLQIQERIGEQVSNTIMKYLEPLGCGVVLEAQHFCMTSRGVEKQNSIMVTNSMKGCFLEPNIKNEFLRMIEK